MSETTEKIVMPKIEKITATSRCGDMGLFVSSFEVIFDGSIEEFDIQGANIAIENNFFHPLDKKTGKGATGATKNGNVLTIDVDPFLYEKGFRISIILNGEVAWAFTKEDVTGEIIPVYDDFGWFETEKGMKYRLFDPKADEPLPLVIWFHGGGEIGTDNRLPLICGRSAVSFAEPENQQRHPCLVLVTQSNDRWSDDELKQTADIAKQLIADGKVDPKRVYVVGIAMMQSTLRFTTYYRDLIAASIPVIFWHSIQLDWSPIKDLPIWCCMAENDFHGGAKYMVQFYRHLSEELGNEKAKLTLYTKEYMDSMGLYGGLSHWSWIPTTNSRDKIDWLFEQTR